MNFEKARKMMVENQLRPNKVTNTEILGVFLTIQKEMFLNNDIKNIAYSDVDINLIYCFKIVSVLLIISSCKS